MEGELVVGESKDVMAVDVGEVVPLAVALEVLDACVPRTSIGFEDQRPACGETVATGVPPGPERQGRLPFDWSERGDLGDERSQCELEVAVGGRRIVGEFG